MNQSPKKVYNRGSDDQVDRLVDENVALIMSRNAQIKEMNQNQKMGDDNWRASLENITKLTDAQRKNWKVIENRLAEIRCLPRTGTHHLKISMRDLSIVSEPADATSVVSKREIKEIMGSFFMARFVPLALGAAWIASYLGDRSFEVMLCATMLSAAISILLEDCGLGEMIKRQFKRDGGK